MTSSTISLNYDQILEILRDPNRLALIERFNIRYVDMSETFDRYTRLAVKVLDIPVSLITIVDADQQVFKSCIGLPEPYATERVTDLSHSFCQYVVGTNDELIVEDARKHPVLKNNLAIRDLNVIAYAGFPLTLENGFTFGSLCAIDTKVRTWTQSELDILKDLSKSVISEIELRVEIDKRMLIEQYMHQIIEEERRNKIINNKHYSMNVHEIMGSISAMNVNIHLLSKQPLAKHTQNYIFRLQETLKQISHFADQILSITRSDLDTTKYVKEETDLAALCSSVFENFNNTFYTHNLQFTVTGSEQSIVINEELVRMTINNLVRNALKYSDDGTTIQMSLIFGPQNAKISVEDEGIGIPEDDLNNLFEDFYRASNVTDFQGLGIGLAIVKHTADLHGGTVHCASVLGQGSTFTVTLPFDANISNLNLMN